MENKNTRRDDKDENSRSGKSKNFNGISGYGRFFHWKSGSNTPLVGPNVELNNNSSFFVKGLPFAIKTEPQLIIFVPMFPCEA